MISIYLITFLTFTTIYISLFFLSKRLLYSLLIIMFFLGFLTAMLFCFKNFFLNFGVSLHIYTFIVDFLTVILWVMFVGIMTAGSRGEYRDKGHFEIDSEVDSNPENSFKKIYEKLPWDFEEEYIEYMDWPGYEEAYTNAFKHK